MDFEFAINAEEYSEYHFGQEKFYKNIKQRSIQFIKNNPQIERTIVENYCDGLSSTLEYMKSKKPVIAQREKTTRDLHIALGMDKNFVLSKPYKTAPDTLVLGSYGPERRKIFSKKQTQVFEELLRIGNDLQGFDSANITKAFIEDMEKNTKEIQQIIDELKRGNQEIALDSKFFFLDNGDNLYDDVIEESAYHEYYKHELKLIQESREAIKPYLKNKYIGL